MICIYEYVMCVCLCLESACFWVCLCSVSAYIPSFLERVLFTRIQLHDLDPETKNIIFIY